MNEICHTAESKEALRGEFREMLLTLFSELDEGKVEVLVDALPLEIQQKIIEVGKKEKRADRLSTLMSVANQICRKKDDPNYEQIKDAFLAITEKMGFDSVNFYL